MSDTNRVAIVCKRIVQKTLASFNNQLYFDWQQQVGGCSYYNTWYYATNIYSFQLNIYRGSRSLSDLEAYVIEMIHPTESTDPADDALDPGKSVISLNDDNFHFHIDSGYTFVKFFAPWYVLIWNAFLAHLYWSFFSVPKITYIF